MRDFGWIAHSGVHAVTDEQGEPRDWHIEDRVVRRPDGPDETISIYGRKGAAGHRELTEKGKPVSIPWRRIRTMRRDRPGGFRFYNAYSIPGERYDKDVIVRLKGNDEDARRGLNRSEHLRAYAPSDPAHNRLMPKRNNAETMNSTFKRTLPNRRAHSVGRVPQEADFLGFQLGLNALADHRHRKRRALAAAA